MKKVLSLVLTTIMLLSIAIPVCARGSNGIANNGLDGIYIDIYSGYYASYASIPTWGQYAYGPSGCSWFASARAKELTGKGSNIYGGPNWYNTQYANFGFSRGSTTPTGKALACYNGHISVVEKVNGNTYTISEGGHASYSNNDYCVIRQRTKAEVESGNGGFLGYVYLGVPFENHVHSYASTITKSATCTETGEKTFRCSCGASYTETISALGHSFGNWITEVAPTEKETGSAKRTCTRCTKTESKVLPVLVYNSDGWCYMDAIPDYISASDYTIQYQNFYEKTATSSPGSDWVRGNGTTTWQNSGDPYVRYTDEATSDSKVLVKKIYYHVCGPSTGDVSNHSFEGGFVHYDSVDPASVNAQYAEDDAGHSVYVLYWKSNGQLVWCQSGVTCDGSYGTHGKRCKGWYVENTYQNRVQVTTYKYTKTSEWTSTKDSSATTVKCRFQPKHTTHTWNGGIVTQAATCAATGIRTYTCTVCTATKTETIAKTTTHKWNAGKITKAATATTEGEMTYTCTVCGVTKKEKITNLKITAQPKNISQTVGTTAKFTVAASGAGTLSYQWKVSTNGTSWTNSKMTGYNTKTLQVPVKADKNGYKFRCVVTDVTGSITSSAATLTVKEPTVKISSQPKSVSQEVGTTAKFAVAAAGSGTLSCQWKVSTDGTNWTNSKMTGYNTPVLQVPVKADKNGYKFRCVITDANGSVTSNTATLTVIRSTAKITTQPKSVTQTTGTTAKFTVAATGTGTLSYQWKVSTDGTNWTNSKMTGYNTKTLQVPVKADKNGYKFRCVVKDANGSVMSSAATLTVIKSTAKISTQPKSISQTVGTTAKFTVAATGSGTLSYQWKVSTDGTNWTNSKMTGYNTATLQVPAKADKDGYKFRCVVTDANGSVTSSAATLTVIKSTAKITAQPNSVIQFTGETATFTVAATGSGTLSYQWKVSTDGTNWTNSKMTGYNTATLQVPAKADKDGYKFRCVVTDANGTVTSSVATLTVV